MPACHQTYRAVQIAGRTNLRRSALRSRDTKRRYLQARDDRPGSHGSVGRAGCPPRAGIVEWVRKQTVRGTIASLAPGDAEIIGAAREGRGRSPLDQPNSIRTRWPA